MLGHASCMTILSNLGATACAPNQAQPLILKVKSIVERGKKIYNVATLGSWTETSGVPSRF